MDRSWHTQGSITKDLTSCDLGNTMVEGNAVVGVMVQAFEKIGWKLRGQCLQKIELTINIIKNCIIVPMPCRKIARN